MNILLINGNRQAEYLIAVLQAKGHIVTVIDPIYSRCQQLADAYEIPAICGDGTKERTLEKAGAGQANAVVALDSHDQVNLIACQTAKKRFHVPLAYASVNNPENVKTFKKLGIQKCVCTADWIMEQVEQDSLKDNLKKCLPIEDGKVVICEVILKERSPALHKKLWEIGFPPQSVISCILRENEAIIPQGNTELEAGDKAILISSSQRVQETLTLLSAN